MTRAFARFGRHERIADSALLDAVERAGRGIVDADLGGGLINQRVGRQGRGRSGGYRMLIAFRVQERTIFLAGFAKNERANIKDDELADLRVIAASWLKTDVAGIDAALEEGLLIEVDHDA